MKLSSQARSLVCAAVLGISASVPVQAAFTCEGQITYLGLTPDGTIDINVGFGTWGICSMTTTTNASGGVVYTPEGCRGWYAAFLAAQKAGTGVRFYFNSSAETSNGPQCSALGHWVYPNPGAYFMVVL